MDERAPLVGEPHGRSRTNNTLGLPFSVSELLGVLLLVVLFVIPLFNSWYVVPPGEIGVVVTLGHVESFGPGLHWRYPYVSHVTLLTAKTQKLDERNTCPTREGLSVQLDTAMYVKGYTTAIFATIL